MKRFIVLSMIMSGCITPPDIPDRVSSYEPQTLAAVTLAISSMEDKGDVEIPEGLCPDCEGRGWVGDGATRLKCDTCDGTGKIGGGDAGPIEPVEITDDLIKTGVLLFSIDNCEGCDEEKVILFDWLERAGWKIGKTADMNLQVIHERRDVADEFNVQTFPTLVYLRKGKEHSRREGVISRSEFSRWLTDSDPNASEATSENAYYLPSGNSRWIETNSGRTSYCHLVNEHGYDPAILKNTPAKYYDLLHGDAHEGRRSRLVRGPPSATYAPRNCPPYSRRST